MWPYYEKRIIKYGWANEGKKIAVRHIYCETLVEGCTQFDVSCLIYKKSVLILLLTVGRCFNKAEMGSDLSTK